MSFKHLTQWLSLSTFDQWVKTTQQFLECSILYFFVYSALKDLKW